MERQGKFPDITDFAEFIEPGSFEEWDYRKPGHSEHIILRFMEPRRSRQEKRFECFVSVSGGNSFRARPSLRVLSEANNLLTGGNLHVVRQLNDSSKALVLLRESRTLGTISLAYVDWETVPGQKEEE